MFKSKLMNISLMKVCIPVLIHKVEGKIHKRFSSPSLCAHVCLFLRTCVFTAAVALD